MTSLEHDTAPAASPRVQRVVTRIRDLPEFWRPVAYGAGFVLMPFLARRAVYVAVGIAVLAVVTSDVLRTIAVLAFLVAGGALSGLVYSLMGRRLRGAGRIGAYAAGILTTIPYGMCVVPAGRLFTHRALLAPFDASDWVIVALVALAAGLSIGYAMRGADAA